MPAPDSMVVDQAGNVYVANLGSGEIFKFDQEGEELDRFGGAGTLNGQFSRIGGIGIDRTAGLLYVSDDQTGVGAQSRVQVFRTDGSFVRSWGQTGNADGQFDRPRGVAVGPLGRLVVAELANHRVQLLDDIGNLWVKWGSFGYGDGPLFDNPNALDFTPDGNVVVGDASGSIRVFTPAGEFIRRFAGQALEPGEPGKFGPSRGVTDLVVDSSGRTIALDREHNRVQVFDADGKFLRQFGVEGAGDGQFRELMGIALGPKDEIYITDVNAIGQAGRVQVFADPAPDPPIDPDDKRPTDPNGERARFRVIKKMNNRKRGTVTLVVAVPSKGTLRLQGTRQTRPSRAKSGKAARLRLTVRAKPRFQSVLRRKGTLKVKVRVTFRPAKGPGSSRLVPVALRR